MFGLFYDNGFKKMNELFHFASEIQFWGEEGLELPKKEDPNYEYTEETKETEESIVKVETWKAKKGSTKFTKTSVQPKKKEESEEEIKAQIKEAVKREDYETAALLKKKIEKKAK